MGRYDSVQIDGKQVRVHVAVWEAAHGPIPKGFEIHHLDGNGHHNELDNLVLLTRKQHMQLHAELRRLGKDPVDGSDPDVIEAREQVRKWAHENAEHVKQRGKLYRASHKEELAKAERAYRETHREKKCAIQKKYYEANREKCLARDKRRYDANADERRAAQRERYAENRDEIRESQRQYELTHKSERAARNAAYSASHREERKAYMKVYNAQRSELNAAKRRLKAAIKRGDSLDLIARCEDDVKHETELLQQKLKGGT